MSKNATEIFTPDAIDRDEFGGMTDRQLLIYIASSHREILAVINEVKDQVMPTIESLTSSPLLRPFLGGK